MVPHQNTHYILHHNDTISEIMRIINQSSTSEIFIYVPEDMDMLYNKTNIALLARVLGKLPSSKKVTFFTPNYHLVDLLQSYRIQAQHSEQIQDHTETEEDPFADFFNYTEKNEFDHNEPAAPSQSKWTIPWKAILGGMGIGLICLLVFFITTIPQADIRISQTGDWREVDFEVRFDPNRATLDAEGYRVPVSEETVTEEVEQTFEATGTSDDGIRARTTIEVKNNSPVDQPLVSNTRFRTEGGLQYRTTSRITVPANGSTEVEVVADEAGTDYNIESQNLQIPGLQGTGRFDQVYGVVSQPITSGTQGEQRFVTEEDINQAKQSLEQAVKDQIQSQEIVINQETKRVVDVNGEEEVLISFSEEPEVGAEISEFSLSVEAEQSRWFFDEEHMKRLIEESIDTTFMDNKYLSDEVNFRFGEPINGEFPQEVLIRVFSEYALLDDLKAEKIAQDLTGKSVEYTEEYLGEYESVESYEVTRSPQYWPFLPFFEYQIQITINQ